jgi:hypothetical protein
MTHKKISSNSSCLKYNLVTFFSYYNNTNKLYLVKVSILEFVHCINKKNCWTLRLQNKTQGLGTGFPSSPLIHLKTKQKSSFQKL